MKKMTASTFKANCLAVLDEVQTRYQTVIITKQGKAVAKLVPVETPADDIYNFMAGRGAITGDVVSPVLSIEEWGDLAGSARSHCAQVKTGGPARCTPRGQG
jgi:prevent-host-death family protein